MDARKPMNPDDSRDHLAAYLSSVARMRDSFNRVGREQRLLVDEWTRVVASLRSLQGRPGGD